MLQKIKKIDKKILALGALVAADAALATTTTGASSNAFEDLLGTFEGWIGGSLGKLLALLGFIGTFIIYLMTHKGSVLFIGVVISLIAGGIAGISGSFFDIGSGIDWG
jgi:hypothetical protein